MVDTLILIIVCLIGFGFGYFTSSYITYRIYKTEIKEKEQTTFIWFLFFIVGIILGRILERVFKK